MDWSDVILPSLAMRLDDDDDDDDKIIFWYFDTQFELSRGDGSTQPSQFPVVFVKLPCSISPDKCFGAQIQREPSHSVKCLMFFLYVDCGFYASAEITCAYFTICVQSFK